MTAKAKGTTDATTGTTTDEKGDAGAAGRPDQAALSWALRAQGDRCLSIDLLAPYDAATGGACLRIAAALREARLAGVTDIIPSFTSVALLFGRGLPPDSPLTAEAGGLERLTTLIEAAMAGTSIAQREVEIPVCYGGEHGPDLEDVAAAAGLAPEELVRRHGLPGATVIMLGFAPGQPYIGLHDPAFQVPRRQVPRTRVPAGSVGIANRQTAIYPNASPGGWHIIGRTPLRLFDADRESPTLLLPGDRVRFRAIDEATLERLLEADGSAAAGARRAVA
jgi:inhibitor of KinA